LTLKHLGQGGRAGRDVSAYAPTTYGELAKAVPKLNKIEKSFVKIS